MNGESHGSLISTQITLKERLDSNPSLADRYWVLADHQSSGRGRGDRQWLSGSGNLHASILIRNHPFPFPTWVPLWISVCAHRALVRRGVSAKRIRLKWPNDLWLDGQFKVSGVLCEKKGDSIIAGIGMNLLCSPIPESAVVPFSGDVPSAESLILEIIHELNHDSSVADVRAYYGQYSLFQETDEVSWNANHGKSHGRVIGLGEYGELIVETDSGRIPLYSEDVSGVTSPAGKDRSTLPNG